MQSVTYSQIPAYLHQSAFFAGLSPGDDQAIMIPCDCLKSDDTVSSVAELREYLKTVRFWGFDVLSYIVVKFTLLQGASAFEVVQEYATNFPILSAVATVADLPPSRRMREAIASGYVSIVKCLREMNYPWDGVHRNKTSTIPLSATAAASFGHLDILHYIHANEGAWDETTTLAAARGGHLLCLQYLHEAGCPWDANCCSVAANCGHLECLRYCHTHGAPLSETAAAYATLNGQLECLRYAFEEGGERVWAGLCMLAVQRGFSAILTYVHERSAGDFDVVTSVTYPASLKLIDAQARVVDDVMLDVLQLALSLGHNQDMKFSWNLRNLLIEHGLINSVRWFHIHVAPYVVEPSGFASLAARCGHLECVKFLTELSHYRDDSVVHNALHHFHADIVHYAIQNGYSLRDKSIPFQGISVDHLLPWYEFAVQQDMYFGDLATHALCSGQVDALQYITEGKRRAKFMQNSSNSVVSWIACWHVDSVAYLHRSGLLVARELNKNGHFKIADHAGPALHYLVDEVGVFTRDMTLWAAQHDDVLLLQQLHENGCEIDDQVAFVALCSNSWYCMRYIVERAPHGVSDVLLTKGSMYYVLLK